MQIITGKYRARKLAGVSSETTRPTLARVKENVFNLISEFIKDAVVLDLFAGSGAYGAECISRGAKKVFFVDNNPLAIKTIFENTRNMQEDLDVIQKDFSSALEAFALQNLKFDIVFLDPPYKSNFAMQALIKMQKLSLVNPNGIIIVEHDDKNDLQNLPPCYIIKKEKKYGIAYISLLEMQG